MSAETIMSAAPADLRTATAFAEKLEAETELSKAAALRHHAVSGGIMVGTAGMVVAACLFAWGARNPSPEDLQAALAKLPPIEVAVTVDGNVKLDPKAQVTLADGGEVTLKDGATVKIDAPASVKLPDAKAPEKTADGTVIKREVTVFSNVDLTPGRAVITGWRYANGSSESPLGEFCYLTEAKPGGTTSTRTELAVDGKAIEIARSLVPDFDTALGRCVWSKGGA